MATKVSIILGPFLSSPWDRICSLFLTIDNFHLFCVGSSLPQRFLHAVFTVRMYSNLVSLFGWLPIKLLKGETAGWNVISPFRQDDGLSYDESHVLGESVLRQMVLPTDNDSPKSMVLLVSSWRAALVPLSWLLTISSGIIDGNSDATIRGNFNLQTGSIQRPGVKTFAR